MYHILGHKTSLNKFKRIEIISSIFSDHNSMKLDINYRKKNGKNKHVETKKHGGRCKREEIWGYMYIYS